MPVEKAEIETPPPDPLDPFAHARSRDAVEVGDPRQGDTAGEIRQGPEDVLDTVGLAGKRLAGKHALASSTAQAAHEYHPLLTEAVWPLKASLHPAARERERRAAAAAAHAAFEGPLPPCHLPLVSRKVNCEYVNHHVPQTASDLGETSVRSRLYFCTLGWVNANRVRSSTERLAFAMSVVKAPAGPSSAPPRPCG